MIIMCSNYLFPSKRNLMLLGVDTSQFDLELKDHVFPSYHAPIILNGSEHLELDIAKFGLLPSWAKELKFSSHTYNARTESVADKPSFRHAWKYSKFCLVPVQEFYEPNTSMASHTGTPSSVKMISLSRLQGSMMMR